MFHSRDGFYFKRLDDGSVRVIYARPTISAAGDPEPGLAVIASVALPPNEWASVLASMSVKGEDGNTFAEALSYHNGAEA